MALHGGGHLEFKKMHKGDFWGLFGIRLGIYPCIIPEKISFLQFYSRFNPYALALLINGLVVVTCAEISPSESECEYYVAGALCVISRHGERVCEGSLKKIWLLQSSFNPLTAKLFNLNFPSLEVVSRWRDPQLQVSENYLDLTKWRSTLFKSCWLMSHFIFTWFKTWYIIC